MNDFKNPKLPLIHKLSCLEKKGCRSFYAALKSREWAQHCIKKIRTAIQLYPERTATSVYSWIPIHWKVIRFHPSWIPLFGSLSGYRLDGFPVDWKGILSKTGWWSIVSSWFPLQIRIAPQLYLEMDPHFHPGSASPASRAASLVAECSYCYCNRSSCMQ